MTARVSIIMRTKDRPLFLARGLTSVTSQSFGDWELLIVNDGGAPEPVDAAVNSVVDEHRSKIRVVHHPAPLGRWEAANAGVVGTSGDLLVLHDDDDSWHPAFLARAVEYLDRHPERQGVVSRIEIVWEEERDGCLHEVEREIFLPSSVAPLLTEQQNFNHFVPIAFLYRRRLHDLIGLYDASLPVIGDWVFNTKVLELGALEYLDDAPYVYWHQRRNANGANGNSVIANRNDHALHDALIRDAAFRADTSADTRALVLYLERRLRETEGLLNQRFDQLEARSRSITSVVADVTRPARGRLHTLFRRRRP